MNKLDFILMTLVMLLVVFLAFMFFRSNDSVAGFAHYCEDCIETSDCDEFCDEKCSLQSYHWAEAKATVDNEGINCSCECSGYIKGLFG